MILVEEKGERDPQLLVIRQTDHAFLAGFLAREWGNEKFTKPQPNASFCLAVAEHDNGWSEWELEPILDAKTRLPFSFMSKALTWLRSLRIPFGASRWPSASWRAASRKEFMPVMGIFRRRWPPRNTVP